MQTDKHTLGTRLTLEPSIARPEFPHLSRGQRRWSSMLWNSPRCAPLAACPHFSLSTLISLILGLGAFSSSTQTPLAFPLALGLALMIGAGCGAIPACVQTTTTVALGFRRHNSDLFRIPSFFTVPLPMPLCVGIPYVHWDDARPRHHGDFVRHESPHTFHGLAVLQPTPDVCRPPWRGSIGLPSF